MTIYIGMEHAVEVILVMRIVFNTTMIVFNTAIFVFNTVIRLANRMIFVFCTANQW